MECESEQQDDHASDDSLISKVHGYEILWNSHIKHYRDKERKDNAWECVAKVMKLSVADVKKDWVRLRTKWGREKRRSNLRSGASPGEDVTSWPHFKSLAFLQPVVKARRIASRGHRTRKVSIPTESFMNTDVKPKLVPLVEPEGGDNELWNTNVNLVPFLDNMNVSQNCVLEIIQETTHVNRCEETSTSSDKSEEYLATVGDQLEFKVQSPSDNVEAMTQSHAWHTPSPLEPGCSFVQKREMEKVLESSVTGLVKALKTFISQAATNENLVAKSENELFVQTLGAMLDKMPAEQAKKKKAKLFMICLNDDDK